MIISDRKKGNIKILELIGRIDNDTNEEFEKELSYLVHNEERILVDCSKLNYINSRGLRTFLEVLKKVSKSKGKFFICSLKPEIQEIFRISGFLNLFDVYNTQESAIEGFQ
jgi:anti-sigma B factor antagonist